MAGDGASSVAEVIAISIVDMAEDSADDSAAWAGFWIKVGTVGCGAQFGGVTGFSVNLAATGFSKAVEVRTNIALYAAVDAFIACGAVDSAGGDVGGHDVADWVNVTGIVGVIWIGDIGMVIILFGDIDGIADV